MLTQGVALRAPAGAILLLYLRERDLHSCIGPRSPKARDRGLPGRGRFVLSHVSKSRHGAPSFLADRDLGCGFDCGYLSQGFAALTLGYFRPAPPGRLKKWGTHVQCGGMLSYVSEDMLRPIFVPISERTILQQRIGPGPQSMDRGLSRQGKIRHGEELSAIDQFFSWVRGSLFDRSRVSRLCLSKA